MAKLREASLDDVCLLVTDGTHDTPKRVKDGFPLIKAKEIGGGKIDFEACDQISEEEHLRVIARSKPEHGDTLFAHIGASLGEAAFVKTDRPFSIKNIALFKPDLNIINERYLYYLVISPDFQGLAKQTKTGSAQPFLSLGHLRSHRITYHEALNEQRKIAAILSAYDDLIENNLRRIKILEEMAQNLYREWFVKFSFPACAAGAAGRPDSPLGRIPGGWEVVSLGKLTELRKDKFKEKLHSECPLLDLAKMQQRTLSVGETGCPDELTTSRIFFEEDDILFGSIRPYLHKVALAPYRGVTNISVLVIRPAEKILQSFLTVFLSSIDTIRWADQHSTGTKMPVIKWEALQTMPVLMPTQAVLCAFETSVQPMLQTVKMTSSRNQNLRHTRNLLLPRIISGEVDVSELDIAVPEEVSA